MESQQSVNEYTITIEGKTFRLKIGLRGIIYLQGLSQYDESDIFTASIITLNSISVDEAKRLFQLGRKNFTYCQPFIFEQVISFLYSNVRDLYSRAVGEIGIDPAIFFQMSPDEIELAYKGYLRRKELEANLNKLAMAEALAGNHDKIQIVEPEEYTSGTQLEREQTFQKLGRDDDRV